ncbi:VOC family protein [Microbacterium testaceum]|uniref:VOC family protein n=1 Tax=Microbacterium testaceum TaxID=2033 RepID=UPI001248CB41|nr:VOC family protein [Microbacterium testaceum]
MTALIAGCRGTSRAWPDVDQVAYVVPDLKSAVAEWSRRLGDVQWSSYTYEAAALPVAGFRGGVAEFEMKVALSSTVPQVELIEPLKGPSVYHEFISRRGHGFHHVGRFVTEVSACVRKLSSQGIEPAQWGGGYGMDGDGGFAYYDAGEYFVEFIEVPRRRRPSEALV